MYLDTLDGGFAKRVRAAVLERAAVRVAMEMVGLRLQSVVERRREDPILLEDLISVAETVSRQNWTYQRAVPKGASLTTDSSQGQPSKTTPEPSSKTTLQRGWGNANGAIELGLQAAPRPTKREPKPAVMSVFAGDTGAAGGSSHVHGEGDSGDQHNTLLTAGFMYHGPETSSSEPEQRGLRVEIKNLRRILEDVREELDWTTNQTILVRTELKKSKTAPRNACSVRAAAPTGGFGPNADGGDQRDESDTVDNEIQRVWATLGRFEEYITAGTTNLQVFSEDLGRIEDRHARLEDGVEQLREQALDGAGLARDKLKLGERRLGVGTDALQETVATLRESVAEMGEAVGDVRRDAFNAMEGLRDEILSIKLRVVENNAPGPQFPNSSGAALLQNWLRAERDSESTINRRGPKTFAPLLTKKQKLALERAETEKTAGAPRKPKRGKRGRSKRVPEGPKDAGLANQSQSDAFEMAQDPSQAPNTETHMDGLDNEFGAEFDEERLESGRVEEESHSERLEPLLEPTRLGLVADDLEDDLDTEEFAEIDVLFDAGLDVDEM
uniref:Uncharacterized protein n=1 Tax=Mycena chlorophos TaxID=658473 RepID=A0ABQ0LGU5_MYCCL|nr:predicted protein [Mycena chlorophos]